MVCGLGNVGFRATLLLRRLDVRVAVVTDGAHEPWLRLAQSRGVELVLGDARDRELLERAGLSSTRALIAATDSDLTNLETALDARRARPTLPVVLRIFDQALGASLEETLGKVQALGASSISGPRLAWAALGERVLGSFELAGSTFLVRAGTGADDEFEIVSRAAYVAQHSAELLGPAATRRKKPMAGFWQSFAAAPRSLRHTLLALGLLTLLSVVVFAAGMQLSAGDALYYVITTVTTTGYGDITPKDHGVWLKLYACSLMLAGSVTMAILFSLVTDWVVGQRVRAALGQAPSELAQHVIVVGMGHVGYRVFDELSRIGVPVLAVDIDADGPFVASLRRGRHVLIGDGRLTETLEAAGVARARAVVAATGDDAVNLAVALGARRLAPGIRSVVRLFDADFAEKVEEGGLAHTALSSSRIAAPVFVASALFEHVESAFVDEQGLVALCSGESRAAGPAGAEAAARKVSVSDEQGRVHEVRIRRYPFAPRE